MHRKIRYLAGLLSLILTLSATSCVELRDSDSDGWSIPGYRDDTPADETSDNKTGADSVAAEDARHAESTPDSGAADDSTIIEEEPAADTEPIVEEPEDPYSDVDISFLAAGDGLVHPNIYLDAQLRGNAEKEYDFLPMLADVREYIEAADIAFINQETVMAGEEYGYSGYPMFNCPRQLGLDLVATGFDIINIANNHMLDMGTAGLADTMDFWNSQPVTLLGAFSDEEDAGEIRVISADGIDIALLSYTYGTNGLVKSAASPIVIPYIDDELILSDLEKARGLADFIIVSMHWGYENNTAENDEQRRLASLLAENGADAIIGHHSHCLQPIEWIETERGRTICIYSLGNFFSGMAYPINHVAGMFTFRIVGDGNGGLTVAEPKLIPTVFYFGMDYYNTHIYLLDDYTPEIASSHGVAITGYTLPVDKARAIVTDVIDSEFLD